MNFHDEKEIKEAVEQLLVNGEIEQGIRGIINKGENQDMDFLHHFLSKAYQKPDYFGPTDNYKDKTNQNSIEIIKPIPIPRPQRPPKEFEERPKVEYDPEVNELLRQKAQETLREIIAERNAAREAFEQGDDSSGELNQEQPDVEINNEELFEYEQSEPGMENIVEDMIEEPELEVLVADNFSQLDSLNVNIAGSEIQLDPFIEDTGPVEPFDPCGGF